MKSGSKIAPFSNERHFESWFAKKKKKEIQSKWSKLHKKDPILHVTTTFSLKQGETRTRHGLIPHPLMQLSIGTLNSPSSRVVKDSTPSRRRILRYINFGIGESSPVLFLDMMNLHLIMFKAWWILNERAFYCFIIFLYFIVNLDLEKTNQLGESSPNFFGGWWILTQLFWKRGELMVNPELMILLKRWTEVKTWGG